MKRFLIVLSLSFCLTAQAQKTITVSGEYIYYPPDCESYEVAKVKALQRAKEKLIAEQFGTCINSGSGTIVKNSGEESEVTTVHIGESIVKGEWLETLGEPMIERFLDKQDILAVRVRIKGRIRELTGSSVDYYVKVLRNGIEDKFESTDFKDGDDLFLSFCSPMDGYLSVYLFDGWSSVYCLLPYLSMKESCFSVEAGEKYVFFSAENAPPALKPHEIDEFCLTCDKELELNRIYCIFSPRKYFNCTASGRDMSVDMAREMGFKEFQQWLSRLRVSDKELTVKTFDVTITK